MEEDKISTLLSDQIQLEFNSFYLYTAISSYCSQNKEGTKMFEKYFALQASEELKHAKGIIDFLNLRRIPVKFSDISLKNVNEKFTTGISLVEIALENEKNENLHINNIYSAFLESKEYSVCNFLDAYINEQILSISELMEIFEFIKDENSYKNQSYIDQLLANHSCMDQSPEN